MSAVKKTVSIDENIVKEASVLNSNFSATVEIALIEYIHRHRVKMAVNSFGKWGKREETSANIVTSLRSQDDREYVTHNNPENEKIKK